MTRTFLLIWFKASGMSRTGLPSLCSLWPQRLEKTGRKLEKGNSVPSSSLIKTFLVSWARSPISSMSKGHMMFGVFLFLICSPLLDFSPRFLSVSAWRRKTWDFWFCCQSDSFSMKVTQMKYECECVCVCARMHMCVRK